MDGMEEAKTAAQNAINTGSAQNEAAAAAQNQTGTAGSGQWGIDDYASAGVEVSVFTIDKDVDAAYYANYIDRLRAIATNYPKKLIGTFRK